MIKINTQKQNREQKDKRQYTQIDNQQKDKKEYTQIEK